MKFHLLPVGARFEVRGRIYVKSGPLTAHDESGGQQLFPRATTVNPVPGSPDPGARSTAEPTLTPQAVREAFDVFASQCRCHLLQQTPALGEQQAQTLAGQIDETHRACLARLGLA